MRRILLSLVTIAIVSASAFGITRAYFSDKEESKNNTLTTGTIDIAVDNQNPWNRTTPYKLGDMKPGQTDYANFVIQNVASNSANVWKTVHVTNESDNIITEPECVENGGIWNIESSDCSSGSYFANNDISSVVIYNLKVWVYDVDPTTNKTAEAKWWQYIYTDDMNKTLTDLDNQKVLLGMIPAGWFMKVEQSYYLKNDVTNWAQGDTMTFDITLDAEQLTGTVLLENKNFADSLNPTIVHGDSILGTLTYGVKNSKFNFSFTGKAPLANTQYTLIFYEEPFSNPAASNWPRTVIVLGTALSDGSGNVSIPSTSTDLNMNILKMKVWLVKDADLSGNTLSTFIGNDYLFELGLMDYYDTDL